MLFNSLHFLYFLPVVFTMYWLTKHSFRFLVLLAASYYFYFSYNPWYGLLLVGTTIIDFYSALKIDAATEKKSKKFWMLVSVISNLSVLVGFKYFSFLINSSIEINNLVSETHYSLIDSLIIPAGLSFYTFQSLSYTIDVYRGQAKADKSLSHFALYVSFFPQLVAGPIERYNDLMPQLREEKKWKNVDWSLALRLCSWGFFKKIVIADRLGEIVTPLFDAPELFSGSTLFIGGFLFVVQVYCDLSGYTDIANGVAHFFGFELCLNWRRPLLSKSLIEFWQRNHISITTWFRDYLYIALGGNRVSYYRWLLNIFLVFVISGLWHGANWTFVIWGAIHGFVYLIELLLSKSKLKIKLPSIVGWIYLLSFHTLALIAFRALNVSDLGIIYSKIFTNFNAAACASELRTVIDIFPIVISVFLVLLLFAKELNEEYGILNRLSYFTSLLRPAFYLFVLLSIFSIGKFDAQSFIYFQF